MKTLLSYLVLISFVVLSCIGIDQKPDPDTIEVSNEVSNSAINEQPYVVVDSSVVRVESNRKQEQMYLYLNIKLQSNIDSLESVSLRISFADDLGKQWFSEEVQIKRPECNFSGWCDLTFAISYHRNLHVYQSKWGETADAFDIVIMNSKEFVKYHTKKYNGVPMNQNVTKKHGLERILIPDAKIEVLGFM